MDDSRYTQVDRWMDQPTDVHLSLIFWCLCPHLYFAFILHLLMPMSSIFLCVCPQPSDAFFLILTLPCPPSSYAFARNLCMPLSSILSSLPKLGIYAVWILYSGSCRATKKIKRSADWAVRLIIVVELSILNFKLTGWWILCLVNSNQAKVKGPKHNQQQCWCKYRAFIIIWPTVS